MAIFYSNIVGRWISLVQILHSWLGLVRVFFVMIKCCCESTWSSLHFCPVSSVWIISLPFCHCNHRGQKQLSAEQAWSQQELVGSAPNKSGGPPKTSDTETDFSLTLAQQCTGLKLKFYIFKHFKHFLCRGQRASCCGSLSHCSCGTGYQPVALIPFCIHLQKGLFHPALGWVTLQPLQPQIHRDQVSVLN